LLQVGAPVQERPLLTVVPSQVTIGAVIAVPAVPDEGTLAQVSTEATVNVPLQVAVLPLQSPELADTDTPLYVPAVGLLQVGAPVQLRPLLIVVPLQVTVGAVIAVPAMPVEGIAEQASTEDTVNVPLQVADFPLQFPELADTDTLLYVPAEGLFQAGAPVQLRPLLTVVPSQVTVGAVIAVLTMPEVGTVAQESTEATVNVPLHVAVLPLQFPELADTDTLLYVPAAGVLQFGAPVQLRPLLTVVPLQVTVGAVIAAPAVPVAGTLEQASTEATVNVPQLAVLVLPPQFAVADTLYVAAAGLAQFGAFVQVMLLVTVLVPHLTVGCVTAVPVTPVIGIPVQVSSSTEGAAPTVNVPLQVAVFPLQSPELADTDMLLCVPTTGLLQFGAPVQLRPLLSAVPLQVTVGAVIVAPAIPVDGTAEQASTEPTVNEPPQVAVLPLQFPELADTDMPLYVPAIGLFQFGAPVQLRPLLSAVPSQVTAGAVIAVPVVPVEGTVAQANTEPTVNLPPQVVVMPLHSP
jgi:hypothetical protein